MPAESGILPACAESRNDPARRQSSKCATAGRSESGRSLGRFGFILSIVLRGHAVHNPSDVGKGCQPDGQIASQGSHAD
jgi:hypothetical protein